MIAKFLTERMILLSPPKTLDKFRDIIGREHSYLSLYHTFNYFHVNGIKGTMKFMGGNGWFVYFSFTTSYIPNNIQSVVYAGKAAKYIGWDFTAASSNTVEDTEENSRKLKQNLMAAEKMISSCRTVEEIFEKIDDIQNKNFLWI